MQQENIYKNEFGELVSKSKTDVDKAKYAHVGMIKLHFCDNLTHFTNIIAAHPGYLIPKFRRF